MSSQELILVTGISGFVGSHVAYQLLEAGRRVRGTVRSAKIDEFRKTVGAKYPNLEIVAVDDIAGGDLSAVLKDVKVIIHVASPLAGVASHEVVLNGAIKGTVNVIRQAVEKGITKIVVTSSWGTVLDPSFEAVYKGVTWTEKDWGKVTFEEAADPNAPPFVTYLASKIFAEQEAWKFASAHPELDLATILPPFIYGPYAPVFPRPAPGTNAYVGGLVNGPAGRPVPSQDVAPYFCHVRDVARAHIDALSVPKVRGGADPQEKRFLISGGHFTWKEAAEHLHRVRPALKDRLPKLESGTKGTTPGTLSAIDTTRSREVLGLKNYIGWQKTVEDTIDALVQE